ncbi:NADP-dependent oxidoreductase domain-containing protein [Xylaria bambusicola]|uniref:NADP-dependent oxidoreductase domain-containing protein n=1 Tax=Xylaria bambusicola TaxID=326684 RepID=UPI002007CE8C|nr:NADP-dependent oxidoreductase domain-containing protein [Xylaria bambusicola]KAI0513182.1 NADP-dependent oxidoreductase domain-containing protein [Xylaria bambusicola]
MAMPRLLYGTAWKKEATGDLVFKALKAGFRGVDTAAQPRHYNEALVAAGIREAISKGIVKREDLFIQTKFTPVSGQDPHNMPYDPKAPLEEQVHASVASSLANFTFEDSVSAYIDSLVLHSPPSREFSDLVTVWKTLETYVPHRIKQLGISNTDLAVVHGLCTSPDVSVRPAVVQNRFYPATRWEVDLRAYCRAHRIAFQTFWTLSGNPELLHSAPVRRLAESATISAPVALYALVLGLEGTTVLDGTTSEEHMAEDLEVSQILDGFAQTEGSRDVWVACLNEFKAVIRES